MKTHPIIEVNSAEEYVSVGDLRITSAPEVNQLYRVLGKPSRVFSGETPAPAGHRNNQVHVYDDLGITFIEHHYTYRVDEVSLWADVTEREYPFLPENIFSGQLYFEKRPISIAGTCREFAAASPYQFGEGWGGTWFYRFGKFSVALTARGKKLASGKRSKTLQVTRISISFPHDPWQKPDNL